MGDEFIQKKNQSFKHRAEKLHADEFASVSVFDANPEEALRLIRFRCPSANPAIGDVVGLIDAPGKDKVRVMLGTAVIGEVDSAGGTEIRHIFAQHPDLHGTLPAKVVSEKDISGFCKAQLGVQ